MTWFGVATRLLRVVRGRGPWVVDLICTHGSSIGGQFVLVAICFLGSPRGRRLHLPCAAPCGGLACGGWRPALDPDVGVPRNELASSSPCGDERAAGPTRFFIARARFEFSRSRVFIASFGHRDRPSPLQLRATCCRIRLRLFRHAATSVLRGLPAFLSLGRVLGVSGVFIVALGLGGRWGLLRHRGPGRRLASASTAATPRRRAVGSSARVGGRRRCARAPLAVFSLPLRG